MREGDRYAALGQRAQILSSTDPIWADPYLKLTPGQLTQTQLTQARLTQARLISTWARPLLLSGLTQAGLTQAVSSMLSDFRVRSRNPVSSSVISIYLLRKERADTYGYKILSARCALADVLSSACGTPPPCHRGLTNVPQIDILRLG